MIEEAAGPINFTMLLTLFGDRLNGNINKKKHDVFYDFAVVTHKKKTNKNNQPPCMHGSK
jgi:hypothetical protein